MAKNKYYVVWKGITPGVYDNWGECKAQVDGQDGAKYKSFETKEEATKAFEKGYEHYLKTASSSKAAAGLTPKAPVGKPIWESLCVDAACSGNPGDMEYRGVYPPTMQEIFRIGPLKKGTCPTEAERKQPSDLFGQSERHRLGKKEEMQDTLRARTGERTDLRYDRTS